MRIDPIGLLKSLAFVAATLAATALLVAAGLNEPAEAATHGPTHPIHRSPT